MTRATVLSETVTLHIPFRAPRRGGRKEMQLPPGAPPQRKADNTLIKALARAFRWKRMLESGQFATIGELAVRERIAVSYLTRVLQLTLLAPDLVEAILDGRQPADLQLDALRKGLSPAWDQQRQDCESGLSHSPLDQPPSGSATGAVGDAPAVHSKARSKA